MSEHLRSLAAELEERYPYDVVLRRIIEELRLMAVQLELEDPS